MSTILKALERLEKDKQGGAPAGGAELAVVRPGVPQEPQRRWPWLAGGVGALALTGVLALWLRPAAVAPDADRSTQGRSAAPVEPAVGEAAPAPSPEPAAQPAVPAQEGAPQAAAPVLAAQPVPEEPTPPAAEPAPPPPTPLAAPSAAPTPAGVASVGKPARSDAEAPPPRAETLVPPASPPPPPAPAPEPVPAVTPAAPPPSPPARAVERPKPRPPPAVARAPEPKVAVERTIWHPEASRRRAFVRLPGRSSAVELHEGDVLGGIQVTRIEPSGVVFAVEGRELRRAVGALP